MSNHLPGSKEVTVLKVYPFALQVQMSDGETKHLISVGSRISNQNFNYGDKIQLHQDTATGMNFLMPGGIQVAFSKDPSTANISVIYDNGLGGVLETLGPYPFCVCCFPSECGPKPYRDTCGCVDDGPSCSTRHDMINVNGWLTSDALLLFSPIDNETYPFAEHQLYNKTQDKTVYIMYR